MIIPLFTQDLVDGHLAFSAPLGITNKVAVKVFVHVSTVYF